MLLCKNRLLYTYYKFKNNEFLNSDYSNIYIYIFKGNVFFLELFEQYNNGHKLVTYVNLSTNLRQQNSHSKLDFHSDDE